MSFQPVALTRYLTTHTVTPPNSDIPLGVVDPLTGSPTAFDPDGGSLALVGLTLITPHPFINAAGNPEFHAPNQLIQGQGTKIVLVDGLPVAFLFDVFN